MFTIIDLQWIKKNSTGELFTKRSPELYSEYVDFCHDGGTPSFDSSMYELAVGSFDGKSVKFPKYSSAGITLRQGYLQAEKMRNRGLLIRQLCDSVINYISGKNDSSSLTEQQVTDFVAAHSSILQLLSANRHNSAKAAIQAITPDAFITQADKDAVLAIYSNYEPKIAELS